MASRLEVSDALFARLLYLRLTFYFLGGLSYLSDLYGLVVDNVIKFEVKIETPELCLPEV